MLSFSGFRFYHGFGIESLVGTVARPALPSASRWRASWVALRFDFFLGKLGARDRCHAGKERPCFMQAEAGKVARQM